jgi:nucleoid-associated protein YgaU
MNAKINRRAVLSNETNVADQGYSRYARLGVLTTITAIFVSIMLRESMQRALAPIKARIARLVGGRNMRLGLVSAITLMISAIAISVFLVAAPASAQQTCSSYTVQQGDTLSAIALRCYGDANRWIDIYQVNRDVIGANPNLIFPGQRLAIAGTPGNITGFAQPVPVGSYVVQPGDNLSSIAQRTYGTQDWQRIYNANVGVIGQNPNLIYPAQRLAIPPAGTTPPPIGRGTGLYMVQPGDTLSSIALRSYGNANGWPLIYQANSSVIGPNPSLIFSGTQLTIP